MANGLFELASVEMQPGLMQQSRFKSQPALSMRQISSSEWA